MITMWRRKRWEEKEKEKEKERDEEEKGEAEEEENEDSISYENPSNRPLAAALTPPPPPISAHAMPWLVSAPADAAEPEARLDGRRRAFEIEAGSDFLGGVVDGVLDLDQVGFADGIKRGHGE